jgi:hypothetical protein
MAHVQGHTFLSPPHRHDILVVLAVRVCSDMAAVNLAQDPSERPGKSPSESFDCFASNHARAHGENHKYRRVRPLTTCYPAPAVPDLRVETRK